MKSEQGVFSKVADEATESSNQSSNQSDSLQKVQENQLNQPAEPRHRETHKETHTEVHIETHDTHHDTHRETHGGTHKGTPPTISAPGTLSVIKRSGTVVPYDEEKIIIAISRAYIAVEGGQASISSRVHESSEKLTQNITDVLTRRNGPRAVHIEEIQDLVELSLMRSGEHKVARSYVLYREERSKEREEKEKREKKDKGPTAEENDYIIVSYGTSANKEEAAKKQKKLAKSHIKERISKACAGINGTLAEDLYKDSLKGFYEGMNISDVDEGIIMSARTFIEREPNYTYVTARLLLNKLADQVLNSLNIAERTTLDELKDRYAEAFTSSLERGVAVGLLNKELLLFDLEVLAKGIKPQRDEYFTYLGLQTLYDRYFLHEDDIKFELPQTFFMRVAMGLAINEPEREKRALEFYHQLSEFYYMSSTPTLFNSGTVHSQMSSCYLTTIADDLSGIYKSMQDNALLSKWAGGLGNDWTPVRSMGAHIKGTNGKSQGVVPFLKVANDTAIAVNQGGKRKGALCSYLETWHLDIEEFLELRKNTGDDRRRTHDMNTANWVPDLFVKRVIQDSSWTLFSPSDVIDLHDSYGKDFEEKYCAYEAMTETGEFTNFKRISAKELWRKMLSMLFETGHPWITFKDVCNIRSPQQHCGVVHSSNLCTEITLNTNSKEIAVCNLGSINLTRYFNKKGELNREKLKQKVFTAVRMLDNVIDINFYPVREARNANLKHRPIGLGIMGFQDVLYMKKLPLSSPEAIEFADEIMEQISYYALEASSDLAVERGAYQSYDGSLWSQGILPIDSIELLRDARGEGNLDLDTDTKLDWDELRNKIRKQKMRNSNVLAIAPTATIANITGVTQSIEPTFQNLYVKSNLSGEFTCVNNYLADDLKKLDLWDNVMINDLKYYEGSVQNINRIPQELKELYATSFEIEPKWLIEAAAKRQKWIDQAQSLNLYMHEPSGKKLDEMYKLAWLKGLKTTYYLRSRSATSAEKSTIDRGKLSNVDVTQAIKTSEPTSSGDNGAYGNGVNGNGAYGNGTNSHSANGHGANGNGGGSGLSGSNGNTDNIQHNYEHKVSVSSAVIEDFEIKEGAACSIDDPACESCQ